MQAVPRDKVKHILNLRGIVFGTPCTCVTYLYRSSEKLILICRVNCEDITEEKCIVVPEIVEGEEVHEVCRTELGEPDCNEVSLELPKERCIEIVYGYAHGYEK